MVASSQLQSLIDALGAQAILDHLTGIPSEAVRVGAQLCKDNNGILTQDDIDFKLVPLVRVRRAVSSCASVTRRWVTTTAVKQELLSGADTQRTSLARAVLRTGQIDSFGRQEDTRSPRLKDRKRNSINHGRQP